MRSIDGELFDQIEDDVGLIRGLAWQISWRFISRNSNSIALSIQSYPFGLVPGSATHLRRIVFILHKTWEYNAE